MAHQEMFKDVNPAILSNIGRPRSMLVVGHGVAETAQGAQSSWRGPATANMERSRVVALELDSTQLARVRDVADDAYSFDPHDKAAWSALAGQEFDLVVLENVSDPQSVLVFAKSFLSDGGHALVAFDRQIDPNAVSKEIADAGFEVMRTDLDPSIVKTLSAALAQNEEEDFRSVRTTSFRYTQEIARPLERIIARAAPRMLADGYVIVARLPPKKRKLSLTVGMLTLNETESVEKMIDDIRAVVPDAKILLIDSSSDETPELAKAKGARVVRQLPPRGHGPAMERLMYEAALESDALIYLDCDFTYPTPVIAHIRELLEEGADVVNASRTEKYPKAMPIPNFLANRFFAGAAALVHGIPTTDVHSGMRGYRSSVIRAFSFDGEGDAIPLDTLILPARSNYNVIEFPIDYNERLGISKLAKLRGTIWTFIRIARAVGKGDRVKRGRKYSKQGASGKA